jgi:hypothetical protein
MYYFRDYFSNKIDLISYWQTYASRENSLQFASVVDMRLRQ